MTANLITSRAQLARVTSIVVKVGSSLLASRRGGVDSERIGQLAEELAALRGQGRRVVLISSGAVAAGTAELGLAERPESLATIQAAAAVGQSALMQVYREAFSRHGIKVGQVLLTRDGLKDRQRFLHARNTLQELLRLEVLPIVNENDTVAVEELKLKLGDNDGLAVSVAQLVDAGCLIILTDVPGLYSRAPGEDGAEVISHVEKLTDEHFSMAESAAATAGRAGGSLSKPGGMGSGGMAAKLNAARAAGMAAIPLVVADGRNPNTLREILSGEEVGTFFAPRAKRTAARRQWIAFSRVAEGELVIDEGACRALVEGKKSLLPIGVKEVRGEFAEGDTVRIVARDGREVARGLANFSAAEARKIAGHKSGELAALLGYDCYATVVHRDNLVVL